MELGRRVGFWHVRFRVRPVKRHDITPHWTGLVNEPGRFWTLHDFEDYVPLANAGSTDHWTVIDFRPIRALAAAGRVEGLNAELRSVVFGFDVGLLIGGGSRATRELMREGGGRRRLIRDARF